MSHAKIITKYLKNKREVDVPDTGFPFLTICRQAGARGHQIGREILLRIDPHQKEGWELFDQKLCALIAQDAKLGADYKSLVAEEYHTESSHAVLDMLTGQSRQYKIQKTIDEIIRLLARLGKVVLVGRSGVCLTRGLPQGLHIRVIGPEEVRVKNLMEEDDLGSDEALKILRERDDNTGKMMRHYFDKDINDPLLYDITFNLGTMSVGEIADTVASNLLRRMRKIKSRA